MLDLWYKNAIIYCLDVETFMDANGDGVGDFRGLTDRLDHLEALGVTTIWLNPFYPSPFRDNGYDIADFYGVDPRFGSLGNFVEFTRAAHDRGMRVLVDLVVNHTSIDHPWFQSARASKDSPYRDWYVWSKERPADITKGIIFPGVQEAVWTFDEAADAWYMHRFYEFQPDLNIANPAVREEIQRIMGYWLQLGVSGFRVDAVPFLVEYKGLDEEPDRDPMLLLSEMHDFLSWRRAGAIMIAEANIEPEKAPQYFGGRVEAPGATVADERMHMIFDFPLNQRTWQAMVLGRAAPIVDALAARPKGLGAQAQWGVFLRNHDELSLDKLSEEEREALFEVLAPDPDMRIYDRGVRRRLAPMLGGDQARIALAHSLLFALPGTPVMWFGDEIGQGENLKLPEREAVRTPMQWSAAPHGGFTDAEPFRPLAEGGPTGFRQANVADQFGCEGTLLSRVQHMVRARRSAPEIGWGETRALEPGHEAVLALASAWRGGSVLTLHNLSGEAAEARLDLPGGTSLAPILSEDGRGDPPAPGPIALPPYAYRWYRMGGDRR